MKLSNIKTKTEFYEFADIWYQRTLALRNLYQNTDESDKRRLKACVLWGIMVSRMKIVSSLAIKLSIPKPPNKNKSCSAIVGEGIELIMTDNTKILLPDVKYKLTPNPNYKP